MPVEPDLTKASGFVHVVFSTHWRREWVQSYEQYRFRLCKLFDRLLDLLEKEPDLVFTFDGQTVVLDDYLALRPQQAERIKTLSANERLVFGPWYILSDQFLEGAEAAVRNLLIGHDMADEFGGVMAEGYQPDAYGSVAVMPAILNGFGIRTYNFVHGLALVSERSTRVFRWQWRDGSEVLALARGYGNGSGFMFHDAASDLDHGPPNPKRAADLLKAFLAHEAEAYPVPHYYLSICADHMELHPGMTGVLEGLVDQFPNLQIAVSTPEWYMQAVEQALQEIEQESEIELECVHGELRGSRKWPMAMQGVLSTDLTLKQANRRCEIQLARLIEPLAAMMSALHGHDQRFMLRHAWKKLLLCHDQSALCACCRDEVMDDIYARLRSVEDLLAISRENWLRDLIGRRPLSAGKHDAGDLEILLFNSLPQRGTTLVQTLVRLPLALDRDCYDLTDADGNRVGNLRIVARCRKDPETYYSLNKDLVGLRCKTVGHAATGHHRHAEDAYTLARCSAMVDFRHTLGMASLSIEPETLMPFAVSAAGRKIENDSIALEVAADGQVTFHDKKNARAYAGLCWFEDRADGGDTYDFQPLVGDVPRYSYKPSRSVVELCRVERNQAQLRVRTVLAVPRALKRGAPRERTIRPHSFPTPFKGERSRNTVDLELLTTYTIVAGCNRLLIQVKFVNRADHHRLRLGFSFYEKPGIWSAHAFGITERAWNKGDELFANLPMTDGLHLDFEHGHGLCLAVKGLYEFEPGADGRLYLTICRSTDTIGSAAGCNYQVEHARAMMPHTIECSLHPSPSPQASLRIMADYVTPIPGEGALADRTDGAPKAVLGMPEQGAIFSALKPAEDGQGLIVRLYNPEGERHLVPIAWGLPLNSVERVELNEQPSPKAGLQAEGSTILCTLQPYEIFSFRAM